MIKDAYYFSHDSNARNDQRIIKLRMKYNTSGYAVYFMIIEMLRDEVDYTLKLTDIPSIAYDVRESEELVKDVILNYDLFAIKGDIFYSKSLKRRMQVFDAEKKKRSNAGKKGMKSRWNSSLQKDKSVITPLLQSKSSLITVKESIVNNSKQNDSKQEEKKTTKASKKGIPQIENLGDYSQIALEFYDYQSSKYPKQLRDWCNGNKSKLIDDAVVVIDQLIRIDGYTQQEVKDTLTAAVKSDFWCSQVIKLTQLRRKSKNGLTKFDNIAVSRKKTNYEKAMEIELTDGSAIYESR